MKKLLLIALLMASWVNAQSDIIRVNDVEYVVVMGTEENEPTISHVWGKNIPARITSVGNGYIFIDKGHDRDWANNMLHDDHRRPFTASRTELPVLWYYVDGGNLQTLVGGMDDTGNTNVYVPMNGTNGNQTFWGKWYWPNVCNACTVQPNEQPFGPLYFINNQ